MVSDFEKRIYQFSLREIDKQSDSQWILRYRGEREWKGKDEFIEMTVQLTFKNGSTTNTIINMRKMEYTGHGDLHKDIGLNAEAEAKMKQEIEMHQSYLWNLNKQKRKAARRNQN